MTFEEQQQRVAVCRACPLCETRTNTVFGVGNERSPLMLIGEAPGQQEDLTGVPFVGPAGKLLDKYLRAIHLSREDVYITNIVKCRPPQNRNPLPAEEDACLPFLREQIKLISPKIIICLGSVAAKRLIAPDFKITVQRGSGFQKGPFQMMATYHPSALLRDPSKKEDALADFFAIKEAYLRLQG